MALRNIVILYGDEEQIERIKQLHLFRGKKSSVWTKTGTGKGYTTNFTSPYEMPSYRLKEISNDFPEVRVNYYYYSENDDTFVLGYKKVKSGEIIDELIWSDKDTVIDKRTEGFAKRFFANCLPYRYNEIFVS